MALVIHKKYWGEGDYGVIVRHRAGGPAKFKSENHLVLVSK